MYCPPLRLLFAFMCAFSKVSVLFANLILGDTTHKRRGKHSTYFVQVWFDKWVREGWADLPPFCVAYVHSSSLYSLPFIIHACVEKALGSFHGQICSILFLTTNGAELSLLPRPHPQVADTGTASRCRGQLRISRVFHDK